MGGHVTPGPNPNDLNPSDPAGPGLRDAVTDALEQFWRGQRHDLTGIGLEAAELADRAAALTAGGKRFRPAFCLWSYVAAGGESGGPDLPAVIRAAASLELLHVGALVHDDVLDGSDTRRGLPSAHRRFALDHRQAGRVGDADAFGRKAAILLGDLLQLWSVQMAQRCGLAPDQLDAALPVLERMRTEVTCGQYLDVLGESEPWPMGSPRQVDLERALTAASRVVEFKSARYTAVRPCQFGAALALGSAATSGYDPGAAERRETVLGGLGRFASPLGRAFQYRDDVLGVFGDPAVTGKPAGDDLREGKRTVLIAHAWARTTTAGRGELASLLGAADLTESGVARLRAVIEESGARAEVENTIARLVTQADAALDAVPLAPDGATALRTLARLAVHRRS